MKANNHITHLLRKLRSNALYNARNAGLSEARQYFRAIARQYNRRLVQYLRQFEGI